MMSPCAELVPMSPRLEDPADSQITPGSPHPGDNISNEMLAAFDAVDKMSSPLKNGTPDHIVSPSKRVTGKQPCPLEHAVLKLICAKCKLPQDSADSTGSSSREFICKACNTKRSTLSQLFGNWPVEHFAALPEEQQVAFWRTDTKGKQQVKEALAEKVTEHRETAQKTTTGGTYLPMSVLERQGFDPDAVALCEDTEDHPCLGMTYNLNLKQVAHEEIKKQVWDDLFQVKKDKKKKKKTNQKGRKNSSSTSSSSSSSSSDGEHVSAAGARKKEAAKRKADAQAAKEAAKKQKAEDAAAAKAQREEDQRVF